MATPKSKPDGRVHIQLKDGSLLVGKLEAGELLILRSVVGEVRVSTTKIVSIMPRDNGKTKIEFKNGDSLTGELKGDKLKLQTSWGETEIDIKGIAGVLSHDRFLNSGTSMIRYIRSTPDGEIVIWQTNQTTASPYPSSPLPVAPSYGAPASYSAPLATPPTSGSR